MLAPPGPFLSVITTTLNELDEAEGELTEGVGLMLVVCGFTVATGVTVVNGCTVDVITCIEGGGAWIVVVGFGGGTAEVDGVVDGGFDVVGGVDAVPPAPPTIVALPVPLDTINVHCPPGVPHSQGACKPA
jgi:hypothetical protein